MSEIDDQALEWVGREAAGPLDAAQQAAFEAWYLAHPRHHCAYLRARAIRHSLDQVTVQASLKPGVAPEVGEPPDEAPALPARPARGRCAFVFGGALAAGIAAVAVASLAPDLFGRDTYETARGEFRKVQLADSSVVSINSGSQVQVQLGDAQRRVMLDRGEAWFEVAKDKARPFIVEAGEARVRAVGTAFSVRRHPHGAEILVTEGVVEIWTNGAATPHRRLAAGELAVMPGDGSAARVSADPGEVARRLAWREGKLVFQNESLANAVAEFNRYNARQIVVADPALRRKTLVGHYRIDQPEEFANDVHALLNVPVAIRADGIRIGAAR
jgi:transmembrane sensor